MTTIPVTLSFSNIWRDWTVHANPYDLGVHQEHGRTPEEALNNYREYLEGEGEEDFILEVEGPTESIEVHEWLVIKGVA